MTVVLNSAAMQTRSFDDDGDLSVLRKRGDDDASTDAAGTAQTQQPDQSTGSQGSDRITSATGRLGKRTRNAAGRGSKDATRASRDGYRISQGRFPLQDDPMDSSDKIRTKFDVDRLTKGRLPKGREQSLATGDRRRAFDENLY